jgi:ankyrin repeat protein
MKPDSKRKQKGGGNYSYEQIKQFRPMTIGQLKVTGRRSPIKLSSKAKSDENTNQIKPIRNTKKGKSLENEKEKTENYYITALNDLAKLDMSDYTDETLVLLDHEGHICKDMISYNIINPRNAIWISNDGIYSLLYPIDMYNITKAERKKIMANNYSVFDMFVLYKWFNTSATLPNNRNPVSRETLEMIENIVIPVTESFFTAVRNGNVKKINSFIQRGVDINFKDNANRTPLHWAAYHGHDTSIQALLSTPGIDVNAKANGGLTPLHIATLIGYKECVKVLLSAPGIKVNMKNIDLDTPLHYTAQNGDIESLRALLSVPRVDVNVKNEDGKAPLHLAVQQLNSEYVRILLADPRINVNITNNSRETPLHLAADRKNIEYIQLLLASPEINANMKDDVGWTPLHVATVNGCEACMEQLLSTPGIEVNSKDINGDTILHLAVLNSHKACIRLLLSDPRVKVNVKNKNRKTPLDLATTQDIKDLFNPSSTNTAEPSGGPSQGGAIYTTYKNREYKIHMGQKGGRYILVGANKQKVYL